MDSENEQCSICYDDDSVIKFQCTHHVCLMCISKLYKARCPLCNTDITSEIDQDIVDEIAIRAISRKDEIDAEVLNVAIQQLNTQDNDDEEDDEEDEDDDDEDDVYPSPIYNEYTSSDIPIELLEQIALEESMYGMEGGPS